MSRFAFGDPSVFACDGLKTVGTEFPKLGWTASAACTLTVTVKLVPLVILKTSEMSPNVLFAGRPTGVWTEPFPLVIARRSCVDTLQLEPPHVP
jgi:hypothetical protein